MCLYGSLGAMAMSSEVSELVTFGDTTPRRLDVEGLGELPRRTCGRPNGSSCELVVLSLESVVPEIGEGHPLVST